MPLEKAPAGECGTVPGGAGLTNLKDELTAATAYNGALHSLPGPVYFKTGLSVACNVAGTTNSDCEIYTK